jgi:hypothetical protein
MQALEAGVLAQHRNVPLDKEHYVQPELYPEG